MTYIIYAAVILQLLNFYMLSAGKIISVYYLTAIVAVLYGITETWVAMRDPDQLEILLFVGLDIWAFLMATRGLIRYYRQRALQSSNTERN